MDLNDYQKQAAEFAIYPPHTSIVYLTLGLASEAGEVAGKLKKIIRDKDGITYDEGNDIAAELGDVLWYVASLARELGFELNDVAEYNILKLASRKRRDVLGGSGDNR